MGMSEVEATVRRTKILFVVLLVSLLTMGFAYYKSRLPPAGSQNPALAIDPVQTPTSVTSFEVMHENHRYAVDPVFDYEIHGLIVSDHNASGFFDISHADWNDFLNTKDICLVWGKNASGNRLDQMKFSSGDWTCSVWTNSTEVWQAFEMNQLSNNHVLPATAAIREAIQNITIGDEVRIKGQLVNYSVNGGPKRKTSTVREDTGNGACEVLYVTEVETLHRHNEKWLHLLWLTQILTIGSILGIFAFNVRLVSRRLG